MRLHSLRHARISGTGSYLPEKRLTNPELERMVDTNHDWIVQRTGIHERRIAAPHEATSDLAAAAARKAIESAGLQPADIDMVIVATVTPDMAFPATACLVQHSLGCRLVPAFDLAAACSGFLYGMMIGRTAIAAGTANHVLLIGAEVLSRFTDYTDRNTCILFGDGAGAVVLSAVEGGEPGIIDAHCAADGSGAELMTMPGGGSRRPVTPENVNDRNQFIHLEGRAVYKQAVGHIIRLVDESLTRCGLSRRDVDLIIPHQMNARIIESAAAKLAIPMEKIYVNIDRYGNTSGATIPIAIDEARRDGRLRPGNLAVLVAFGGGMTWGSALIRW